MDRVDPDALMAGELGQWLTAQDTMRAEAKAKAARIQTMSIVAAGAVAFLVILFKADGIGPALKWRFIIGAAGFGWAEWSKRPAITAIKGGINGAIARALGLHYAVEHEVGAEFATACTYDMLPGHDRASFEDLWQGEIGGNAFQLYEARPGGPPDTGKSRHWVTVFAGSIITLSFARRFQGVTLIERAEKAQRFFGLLGDKDELERGGQDLRRIDLVDPAFTEQFSVWSSDPAEAHYLVHPDYVQRLIAIEQAFSGKNLRALFHDGELLIALESGNLFESGSLDAGEDRQRLEQSIQQFGTLADLAEKLNERARPGLGRLEISSDGCGIPPSQTA